MAQAFFNKLSKRHTAFSAGTHAFTYEGLKLSEFADPVLKCMAELGYDLSENIPTQISQNLVKKANKIVAMTNKEDLPIYVKNHSEVIYWDIEDAAHKSYEFHIKIRNQVKDLVEKLVKEIDYSKNLKRPPLPPLLQKYRINSCLLC